MAFHSISPPGPRTLRDKYAELIAGDDAHLAEAGRRMIRLIEHLEATLGDRHVWALTSHYHLKLLAADDARTPWYISIAPAVGPYVIDYLMPSDIAPWPDARVVGEAEDVERAAAMIRIAMAESGGWHTA